MSCCGERISPETQLEVQVIKKTVCAENSEKALAVCCWISSTAGLISDAEGLKQCVLLSAGRFLSSDVLL